MQVVETHKKTAWSGQQEAAIRAVKDWLDDETSPQLFRLFGYAGTGKTTLAKEVASGVGGLVLFGAFTGKAALVLRSKGCSGASTIHSLIYRVKDKGAREVTWELNPESEVADAQVVIIDECSMVDEGLGRDLLSFGAKVLVLGDPAQLPPVKGTGFFVSEPPNVMLDEIHRQAAGNPIIQMATTIREGRNLQPGTYGESKVIRGRAEKEEVLSADQVLVGLNKTRRLFNSRIRELKGRSGPIPVPGDRLVCLKNKREKALLNGSLWEVMSSSLSENLVEMEVVSLDETDTTPLPTRVKVPVEFFRGQEDQLDWKFRRFYEEFDYGYALTTHKAQGSQWNHVVLYDESGVFRDDAAKWLYTGVTRAAERITVVKS